MTVFVESAGATSVLALLATPFADGLFARAIAQSPALPLIADRETRPASRGGSCNGWASVSTRSRPCRSVSRAAPPGCCSRRAQQTHHAGLCLTYGVELLPRHPIERAAGQVLRVPLIVGTNSHEASMFAYLKPPMLLDPRRASTVTYSGADVPPNCATTRTIRVAGRDVIGSDAMFPRRPGRSPTPTARTPRRMYRFDHTTGRCGRRGWRHPRQRDRAHPAQLRVVPGPQAAPARAAGAAGGGPAHAADLAGPRHQGWERGRSWSDDWPLYDTERRRTRVIRSTRDVSVDDPHAVRRAAGRPVLTTAASSRIVCRCSGAGWRETAGNPG